MNERLLEFLTRELEERGWSQRELSRRAGLSQTSVSVVIAGQRKPTFEFLAAIAKPLGYDPVELFKLANLIPGQSKIIQETRGDYNPEDSSLRELYDYIQQLSPDERLELLRYIRFRQSEKRRWSGSAGVGSPATGPD